MQSIEEVLKINKNVYLWDDKKTLDVVLNNEKLNIVEELSNFKCLVCDNNVISETSELLKKIGESDFGVQIKCHSCEQQWFVHKPIVVPKSLINN